MPKISQAQEYLWKPVKVQYNECCGGCGSPLDLEYDHIVPRCKGGTDHVTNIQILCH
ncbi:MAG: HNH endonuclease, partial [bacterium]